MDNWKELERGNDEHLMRIQLICKQAKQYIQDIEHLLLQNASYHVHTLQLIEEHKDELETLCKQYTFHINECTFDKIRIQQETVEYVKQVAEQIKQKVVRLVFAPLNQPVTDYIFTDQLANLN